jgi:cardiolipin synthase
MLRYVEPADPDRPSSPFIGECQVRVVPAQADHRADAHWEEPDGSAVTLFSEGDVLFEAMLADIAAARERVWLESYIFATDAIGQAFVDRLVECAARGVDVRIRVDAVGSHFGFSGSSAARLGGSGARFRRSKGWEWRRPKAFHRRNHRKLLVVDDRAAYLGGFNISALNSRRITGDLRWRDSHVRLSGPIMGEAAMAFEAFARGDTRWSGDASRSLYIMSNYGRWCRYRLRCLFQDRLAEARERIWLTTPYFVPDSATQAQLCAAAARGVDVRILVPGKSDVRIVQWASRASYSQLLRAGVQVFEYQPRTLHAKTLLKDRDWATVGTANFDYRSFFINYELNLIGSSTRLNAALASQFECDLQSSREVLKEPWSARPFRVRLAELIGWTARRWL